MDGGIGLTIDTQIKNIDCLGLGVYAFWEIVKVERWWEYTVQPMGMDMGMGMDEPLRWMEERKHNLWDYKSSPTRVPGKSELMRDETREGKLQEKRPLKRDSLEKDRSEVAKRRKRQLEDEINEIDEIAERRKRELDKKLEIMRLKNQNPPPVHALAKLVESTNLKLRQHDNFVKKQRRNLSNNEKRIGQGEYKEMLQRFEISWERQRQDIINSDPQFRSSNLAQENLHEMYQAQKDERLRLQKYEEERSLCLEAIQEQLDIAKRQYPESSFTIRSDSAGLRPNSDIVHLNCGFCSDVDIYIDQSSSFQVVERVQVHQTSIDHIDRYLAATEKKLAKQSEGKNQRKKIFTSDDRRRVLHFAVLQL